MTTKAELRFRVLPGGGCCLRPCGADPASKEDLLEALAEACVDAWALSQRPIKQPSKAKNSSVQHKIGAAALERDGRGVLGRPQGSAGETGAVAHAASKQRNTEFEGVIQFQEATCT